jgi:hypothetical protein
MKNGCRKKTPESNSLIFGCLTIFVEIRKSCIVANGKVKIIRTIIESSQSYNN